MSATESRILIVDDDKTSRDVLSRYVDRLGYETTLAKDGEEAWQELIQNPTLYDVILLDYMMPRLDGLGLLKRLRGSGVLRNIPVVMQTAKDETESIKQCLEEGAYYYLTKPYEEEVLTSVVKNALDKFAYYKKMQTELNLARESLTLMQEVLFKFRTLDDVQILSVLLANLCPQPNKAILGLSELMLNAIEHGNLEIGYEEKSRLKEEHRWLDEVNKRLGNDTYLHKEAEITLKRLGPEVQVTITDQGDGFDWEHYIAMSPERAFDLHGRGIAIANHMCFSQMRYLESGRMVQANLSPL